MCVPPELRVVFGHVGLEVGVDQLLEGIGDVVSFLGLNVPFVCDADEGFEELGPWLEKST